MEKQTVQQVDVADIKSEEMAHVSDNHEHRETVPSPADDEGTNKIDARTWLALISLAFTFSLPYSTLTLVSAVIVYINEDIGPVSYYTWMSASKTVATATSALLVGTLSDLFGRRWITISCGLLGLIGCIIGATAQSVAQVILSMTIIGVCGGISVNMFAAAAELVAVKQRGYAMALINGMTMTWASFGVLIANSMLLTAGGWRSIFYLGIGVNTLGATLAYIFYYPEKPLALQGTTRRKILTDFDWIGLIVLTIGTTLVTTAIIWLGGQHTFASAHVLGTFIPGVLMLIGLGFYEPYVAKSPLLHPYLFKRLRTFTLYLIVTFVSGMLYYSLLTFFPQYLRLAIVGNHPIKIGTYALPLFICASLGGTIAGLVTPHIGHTRASLTFGIGIQVLFIGLMAIPNRHQVAMSLVFSGIGGLGIGWEQILAVLLVQLSTSDEWIGFAGGVLSYARYVGGSVGIAVYTSIFQKEAARLLPRRLAATAAEAGLPAESIPAFVKAFLTHGGNTTGIDGVTPAILQAVADSAKDTYVDAFKPVWYASLGFGAVAIICAVCTKDISSKFTNRVAIRLAKRGKTDQMEVKVVAEDWPTKH